MYFFFCTCVLLCSSFSERWQKLDRIQESQYICLRMYIGRYVSVCESWSKHSSCFWIVWRQGTADLTSRGAITDKAGELASIIPLSPQSCIPWWKSNERLCVCLGACHLEISSRRTNSEANEKEETGNALKNALRGQEEGTEESRLSLCPGVEAFNLAGTGSQVISTGAQASLLQRGQMLL